MEANISLTTAKKKKQKKNITLKTTVVTNTINDGSILPSLASYSSAISNVIYFPLCLHSKPL